LSDRRSSCVDYKGIEVIGASRRVGGTDWVLVVEQDRQEASHSAEALKHYIPLVINPSIVWVFLFGPHHEARSSPRHTAYVPRKGRKKMQSPGLGAGQRPLTS